MEESFPLKTADGPIPADNPFVNTEGERKAYI